MNAMKALVELLLKSKDFREALIALGWTPPSGVHTDLEGGPEPKGP